MERYEQFAHTADIGVRIFGRDIKELFVNAAFAMFDVMADIDGMKTPIEDTIEAEAGNQEELLVAWLDELLYRATAKDMIYSQFEIEELTETRVSATAYGISASANRNRLKTEIKAITYSDLNIRRSGGTYQAEVIFDV
jgi:SHS2 domain-containing protein